MSQVVLDAQHRKPSVQVLADRIARRFVPAILIIALATWATWTIITAFGGVSRDELKVANAPSGFLLAVYFGCATLVVACPCALGLATPTAVMVGCGVAAKSGILLKGGDVLETASKVTASLTYARASTERPRTLPRALLTHSPAKVTAVLFDKTGTLTKGEFALEQTVLWSGAVTQDELLARAASAERDSEHPIGAAIVAAATRRGVSTSEPTDFTAVSGAGVDCHVDGMRTLLGTRGHMRAAGLDLGADQEAVVVSLESRGCTTVLVGLETTSGMHLAGALALADALKPEAPAVIEQLRRMNVEVSMVTGDNGRAAARLGAACGIAPERIVAGVRPVGKMEEVPFSHGHHLHMEVAAFSPFLYGRCAGCRRLATWSPLLATV